MSRTGLSDNFDLQPLDGGCLGGEEDDGDGDDDGGGGGGGDGGGGHPDPVLLSLRPFTGPYGLTVTTQLAADRGEPAVSEIQQRQRQH